MFSFCFTHISFSYLEQDIEENSCNLVRCGVGDVQFLSKKSHNGLSSRFPRSVRELEILFEVLLLNRGSW